MASPSLTAQPDLYRFLRRALSRLRWVTLAAMLLITVMQPTDGRMGLPTWWLVLAFAGYNLLVDLLRLWRPGLRSLIWMAVADLPVAAVLYYLGAEADGPLFILFLLAVDSAAASMTLRALLLYTAATAAAAAAIEVTLPAWSSSMADLRGLGARLIMLALVGIGMAIVTRRLAMEHEASRSVLDEAGRLEELDRLRVNFISTTSHELRTPLTAARAALGLIEVSAGDRLRPDERALFSNARRNTERLTILIDDLLSFNQLEAGTLRPEREPLDLRTVVADSLSAVHPLILQKGQMLEIALPDPLPFVGDPRQLEQVVVNLLANAHLHTPGGTRITVSGGLTPAEVSLTVSDTGPGIPPTELDAVFRRFHRLAADVEGSGLGLAIARGIVELHGGRMWAESPSEGGAAFHVALPRDENGGTQ